ncbi:protein kinase [Trypanosoma grayi]|uniref:protein kinase n=1 Tax=Trypanosoma grayi TaxID=71804 RepID=UPI0004F41E08|nr:protein kinase [Trypanosoma grayi]KEG11965.1 protein kinase [Trypanosoma grayi]
MHREMDTPAEANESSADCSASSGLRISIPKSPGFRRWDSLQDTVAVTRNQNNLHLSPISGLSSTGASPLNAGDLGKQIAAAEVSNKISSQALLSVTGSRFMHGISHLEVQHNESSLEESAKELRSFHGLLHDDPLQTGTRRVKATDVVIHDSENDFVPMRVKHGFVSSPCTPTTPGGMRVAEPSDRTTVTLEDMLRDASKNHGVRLTWLLYGMISVVVIIFLLLIGQVQLVEKNNIVAGEEEIAAVSAATSVNQLRSLQYSTKHLMQLFDLAKDRFHLEGTTKVDIGDLCASIGGAALVFATYSGPNGSLTWSYECPIAISNGVLAPPYLSSVDMSSGQPLRIAIFHSDYLIATMGSSSGSEVLLVVLAKEPVGQLLLANSIPAYSSLTLKRCSVSFIMPEFTSTNRLVALHSLSKEYDNYSIAQPTPLAQELHRTFDQVCAAGKAYTWHNVMRPDSDESFTWKNNPSDFSSGMPSPYIEYKGVWGGVSRVALCGALCYDHTADSCVPENPTAIWFIVSDEPLVRETQSTIIAVVAVSTAAVVLFLVMILIAYFSISVPVKHLNTLIFSAVGDKRVRTKRENLLFQYTRSCWLGDLQALVRTFQLLVFCFRLNKKYVPQHILEQQVLDLQTRKDFLKSTIVEELTEYEEEDEDDDETAAVNGGADMTAFVNTVSVVDGMSSMNKLNMHEALAQPAGRRMRRESSACFNAAEGEVGETSATFGMTHNSDTFGRGMAIVESATILSVYLCAVEMAYFSNYGLAVKQHRRIMNLLLGRIRHYRGELFQRSGDCIAATWNAFESRTDHAQRAAACALSIARLLAPYRQAGFRVGIVLHQGPFVCGVVQDNKEAFTTVFGSVPRQALALAELAASLPCFNVLVAEPVKQSLSSLYECIMVDVIKYHEDDTPMVMFELGEERKTPLMKGIPQSSSAFAEEHACVFFDFRHHNFDRALAGIETLRMRFPRTGRRLLSRIEVLCQYYKDHSKELPLPYFRNYPTWPIYEAIANVDATSELLVPDSKDDGLTDVYRFPKQSKSIYEDDTVKFRQELHDNVLASRRVQGVGTAVKPLDAGALRSGATSCKATPASAVAESQLQPEPFSLPPSPAAEIGSAASPVMAAFAAPAAGSETKPGKPVTLSIMEPLSMAEPLRRVGTNSWKQSTSEDEGRSDVAATVLEGGGGEGGGGGATGGERDSGERGSVLSIRTPNESCTEDNGTGEAMSGDGRQRFSFTNRLGPTVIRGCSRSHLGGTDSFVSFQSDVVAGAATLSLRDLDGSFTKLTYELPKEIVAKNGITYLRSSRILGKGSFGCVYLGMDVLSGRMVAIKFLPLPSDEEEVSNVETEVVTMQKVKSSHVVEFISYAFKNDLIIIIMECMMAGSLQGMLSSFNSIPSMTARLFIRDVLRGLHKLHSMGVIHRDVKPQNVLLTLAGNCKISDFGASAFLQELVRRRMEGKGLQVQGTPVYLAPEAARGTPEEKSDIWSCGIVFIQLVTGKLPYAEEFLGMPPQILVFQIGSGAAMPIIPESLDKFDTEFVRSCLKVSPDERLSAKRLLELPMFAL